MRYLQPLLNVFKKISSFVSDTAILITGVTILLIANVVMAATQPTEFPLKPITMIVPYGVGGGSDQLSRAMVESIKETAGLNFDVVNIPKGAGLGAIPDFMTKPADGYTVMEHIDEVVAAFASGAIKEHPGRDWEPLAIVQITFSQIFINTKDDRFHDWPSFLAYAKANPGKVVVANVSYDGSMENLTMKMLERALGFKTIQVSFDNIKERYEAVFNGNADVLFEQPGDVRAYLDKGRLKPILTFYPERPEAFADVPTHKQVGADFEALLRFRGFFVKKGIPQERRAYLEKVFFEAFKSPSFQEFNRKKYMTLIYPYRGTGDSVQLIDQTIQSYRENYQDMLHDFMQEYLDSKTAKRVGQ